MTLQKRIDTLPHFYYNRDLGHASVAFIAPRAGFWVGVLFARRLGKSMMVFSNQGPALPTDADDCTFEVRHA